MQSENEFYNKLNKIKFFSDELFIEELLNEDKDSLYTIKKRINGVLKCFIIKEL